MNEILTKLSISVNILPYYGTYHEWRWLFKQLNWRTYKYWMNNANLLKRIMNDNKELKLQELIYEHSQQCCKQYGVPYLKDGLIWVDIDRILNYHPVPNTKPIKFENIDCLKLKLSESCYIGDIGADYESGLNPRQHIPVINYSLTYQVIDRLIEFNSKSKFQQIYFVYDNKIGASKLKFVEKLTKMTNHMTIDFSGIVCKDFCNRHGTSNPIEGFDMYNNYDLLKAFINGNSNQIVELTLINPTLFNRYAGRHICGYGGKGKINENTTNRSTAKINCIYTQEFVDNYLSGDEAEEILERTVTYVLSALRNYCEIDNIQGIWTNSKRFYEISKEETKRINNYLVITKNE